MLCRQSVRLAKLTKTLVRRQRQRYITRVISLSIGESSNIMNQNRRGLNSKAKTNNWKSKNENRSALDENSSGSNNKIRSESGGRGSGAKYYTSDSDSDSDIHVTDDFKNFIKGSNGARRYKVHKPGCSCHKIVNLRSEIELGGRNDGTFQSIAVVPDVKRAKSVFEHTAVSVDSYNSDPLGCEKDLSNAIFPNSNSSQSDTHMVDIYDIKVSCANCMLEIEPNGFVCCASSKENIERARDLARIKIDDLQSSGITLHHDHADFICCLSIRVIKSLINSTRRRGKVKGEKSAGSPELLKELLSDNVPVDDYAEGSELRFSVGHHLKTALEILQRTKDHKNRVFKNSHILVIITKSKRNDWLSLELDLTGGKRHLGERSFECAVRETMEESSLSIDKSWLVGDGKPMFGKSNLDHINAFFMVEPPGLDKIEKVDSINPVHKESADKTLAQLEKDIFWSNTGLGI